MKLTTIHLGILKGTEWDGNPLALEPIEIQQPACKTRTVDYPTLTDNEKEVTCKNCLRIIRAWAIR